MQAGPRLWLSGNAAPAARELPSKTGTVRALIRAASCDDEEDDP